MCCILDDLLGDLFTLIRQIFDTLWQRIEGTRDRVRVRRKEVGGGRSPLGSGAPRRLVTTTTSSRTINTSASTTGRGSNIKLEQNPLELNQLDPQNQQNLNSNLNSNLNPNTNLIDYQDNGNENVQYPYYEYKMMSKKGLLKFVKYTLIFSNAFGFILSIFLGLFGIAYPDKHFPLSYKGREMALCSLFCMLFTTIGYCGAQNHRRILLIVYGATNVIIVIIVVILWVLFKENSILGNKEISNMFITTLAITIAVMFLFSFILAFHIQTFKDDTHDSIVSQSHQLLQQTTAFLRQQQQQQLATQNLHPGGPPSGGGGGLVGGMLMGHMGGQNNIQMHHHQQQQPIASSSGASFHQSISSHHHNVNGGNGLLHAHQANMMIPLPLPQQLAMKPMNPPAPLAPVPHMKQTRKQQQQQQQQQQQVPGAPSGNPIVAASQLQHSQILIPPPQVPPPQSSQQQQMTLSRNQSSPLPGQQQQTLSRSVASSKSGQHYQSTKQNNSNIIQPDQVQPPPPPPPSMYHHSVREHHSRSAMQAPASNATTGGVSGNRLSSCPVQYCTFQCDRTV